MKEELQSKLVEILTSIQTAAGKASDFALAELPDIAQSYIVYGRAWGTVEAVMLWALLAWIVVGVIRFERKNAGTYSGGMGYMVGGAAAVFAFVGAMVSTQAAALVWFAPKVWLLKEIAGLLK